MAIDGRAGTRKGGCHKELLGVGVLLSGELDAAHASWIAKVSLGLVGAATVP